MKSRLPAVLALALALVALGHSIWLQRHAEVIAQNALLKREQEFVRSVAPDMRQVYQEMIGPSFSASTFHPTTLEELVRPFTSVLEKMSGAGEPSEKEPR
jgi:hypothetical protein